MKLKVLLPDRVFLDIGNVRRVTVETRAGSYGLLPNRLDCTASLVAGILQYEAADGVRYIAVEEGVLVKAGAEVLVSVRDATGDAPLGELKAALEARSKEEREREINIRSVMARLERSFMRNVHDLSKD